MRLLTKMDPSWSDEELHQAKVKRAEQMAYLGEVDPDFVVFLGRMKKRFGGFHSVEYGKIEEGTDRRDDDGLAPTTL